MSDSIKTNSPAIIIIVFYNMWVHLYCILILVYVNIDIEKKYILMHYNMEATNILIN